MIATESQALIRDTAHSSIRTTCEASRSPHLTRASSAVPTVRGVEFLRRDGVVLAPYGAVDTLTVTSAGGSSLRLEVVALRRGRR